MIVFLIFIFVNQLLIDMSYPQTIFFSEEIQNDVHYYSYQNDYKIKNNEFMNFKKNITRGHLITTFKKEFYNFIHTECILQPLHMYNNDNIIRDKINDFVIGYVYRDLNEKQIESIITSYGLTKGFALFHDFHVIKHYCSVSDFCDYFTNQDIQLERCLVELILFESIGILKNKSW